MITTVLIKRVKNTLRRYPLSLIVICVILFLTFYKTDNEQLPEMFPHFDKLVHFMMYFGFCTVLWFEYYHSHPDIVRSKLFWGAIIGPILFSGALEIAQSTMTAHRSGDFLDFLFNTLGVISAAFVAVFIIKPIIKR